MIMLFSWYFGLNTIYWLPRKAIDLGNSVLIFINLQQYQKISKSQFDETNKTYLAYKIKHTKSYIFINWKCIAVNTCLNSFGILVRAILPKYSAENLRGTTNLCASETHYYFASYVNANHTFSIKFTTKRRLVFNDTQVLQCNYIIVQHVLQLVRI